MGPNFQWNGEYLNPLGFFSPQMVPAPARPGLVFNPVVVQMMAPRPFRPSIHGAFMHAVYQFRFYMNNVVNAQIGPIPPAD